MGPVYWQTHLARYVLERNLHYGLGRVSAVKVFRLKDLTVAWHRRPSHSRLSLKLRRSIQQTIRFAHSPPSSTKAPGLTNKWAFETQRRISAAMGVRGRAVFLGSVVCSAPEHDDIGLAA